jgi:hypothetical protein
LDCVLTTVDGSVPSYLSWEREGAALSARQRPGLSLETERLGGQSRARLFFDTVRAADSGKYSCTTDLADTQSVHLVVGKGTKNIVQLRHISYHADTPSVHLVAGKGTIKLFTK